jgi:hypothetical protein
MDEEEAKKKILKRLYGTAMRDYLKHELTHLKDLAEKEAIDPETLDKVYDELERAGFFKVICAGMVVEPSLDALVYCERQGLVEEAFVGRQNEVRIGILDACLDLEATKPRDVGIWGYQICAKANISELEFNNNIDLLAHWGLVERYGPFDQWKLLPNGKEKVKDYRCKRDRKKRFEDLKELRGVTPQQRGHGLEDLLEEVIAEEGWTTEKRIHQKGLEFDIVFNRDYSYFMTSCKWEKGAIEADHLDQLVMRAQEMDCVAAVLVSMSGFTKGCILRAVAKRPIKQVVLFGPSDMEAIFQNERTFSNLLDEKIKALKHRSIMLIDGLAR